MRALKVVALGPALAATLLVSACGPLVTAAHRPQSARLSAQQARLVTAASQLAGKTLAVLKSSGLPIGESHTFTAGGDPDHLLATPGQYIGKITFQDTRLPTEAHGADISVVDGGCIEVFASLTDASATARYLQSLNASSGPMFFTEYDYWRGIVLLRVSSQLDPDQAAAYQVALDRLPPYSVVEV